MPWIGSFGGRSLKSASNSVASSVSFSTSWAASASSLSRCRVRTSWARAYALSMISRTSSSIWRATSSE
jgi:hypothetical protein